MHLPLRLSPSPLPSPPSLPPSFLSTFPLPSPLPALASPSASLSPLPFPHHRHRAGSLINYNQFNNSINRTNPFNNSINQPQSFWIITCTAPQSRHATTIIKFLLIYSSKMMFEPTAPSPHSSSGDFTSIFQISAR